MYQKRNKELEIINLYTGNYNKRLYLRQISKLLKLPLKTTQNALAKLEKETILKTKTEGKNKYFNLNLENIQTKNYLLQAEMHKTIQFTEKNMTFKIFMKAITTETPIIIFGSYAKGTAEKNSDIDILTLSKKEQQLPTHLLPQKIHKINLSEKTFIKALKIQEILIKEIEENHIILNNHSFFVNALWTNYGKQ